MAELTRESVGRTRNRRQASGLILTQTGRSARMQGPVGGEGGREIDREIEVERERERGRGSSRTQLEVETRELFA